MLTNLIQIVDKKGDGFVMTTTSNETGKIILASLPIIIIYLILFVALIYTIYKFYNIFRKIHKELEKINENLKNNNTN